VIGDNKTTKTVTSREVAAGTVEVMGEDAVVEAAALAPFQ